MSIAPNRVAVYLTAGAGLLGGLAPVAANLDLSSTVGVAAGLAAVTGVVYKWLDGWQKHEARISGPDGEAGDTLPGVPHLPTTNPAKISADQVDRAEAA